MSIASLYYEIIIDTTAEHVYSTMIEAASYKAWTSVFNPSSHYRGSWDAGSKILFIGCDAEGNEAGMVSRIKANIKGKFISIEHIGEYKDQEEITSGPNVETWAGSLENYFFEEKDGRTLLKIELTGGVAAYADYFNATWPKALETLKGLCESSFINT